VKLDAELTVAGVDEDAEAIFWLLMESGGAADAMG